MYILWPNIYMEYTWHIPTIYLIGVPDGRSTVQWWMRNVQGTRGRLKCIGHGPRGDSGWVDVGSFGADGRWGECQRATQRRRSGGARGAPGREVVCAGGYCAWRWVLYMVWAWHRLDLHGDTCGLRWGNFVNKIRFQSIFCIFCISDILCILYRLSVDWDTMLNVFKEEHKALACREWIMFMVFTFILFFMHRHLLTKYIDVQTLLNSVL
jgi:hypothetical protein